MAELRSLAILDSAPSEAFRALVESACRLLDVPICFVSLIDEDRQWFKAATGLSITESPRDAAFCSYTILGDDLLVVEDARADERFRENPFVTSDPNIRFYAGAPLIMGSGHALGSFCVIDSTPRKLSVDQRAVLRDLSFIAVGLVESYRTSEQSLRLAAEADRARCVEQGRSRQLKLHEIQFRQTEKLAKVGGWELDLASQIVSWSDEVYRIYEIPVGTTVTYEIAVSIYPEKELARLSALIERLLMQGICYDDEFEIVTASGAVKWIRTVGDIEFVNGVATRLFGIFQDVSQRRAAERELWYAANYDAMTGLANRAQFTRRLEQHFHDRDIAPRKPRMPGNIGLLMIDVDRLKEVNDTMGHAAGDMLLRTVAERLTATVGAGGIVARIGGDEFVVTLVGDVAPETLASAGEAIVKAMRPKLQFEAETVSPKVSIGGAIATDEDTADLLRRKADLALYESKRNGRGHYAEFREDMRASILQKINVVRNVDEALGDGRIVPYYQPIVRIDTGEIVGAEALARMRTPDGSIVAAGAFQEAFGDHRIAYRLTERMLAQIARDLRSWLEESVPFQHVGINITSADFQAGDIVPRIREAFRRQEVPLSHIVIEVTEMVFLGQNDAAVTQALEDLRGDGALVALDDFGTGFASLTQLRTLPVDLIKIDKSFVKDITGSSASGPIVETLIDLARKLGLRVVAEGIETIEQAEHLKTLGCVLGQGYLFARPGSRDMVGELMRRFGQYAQGDRLPLYPKNRLSA